MPSLVVAAMRGVVGKPIVHNSNIRSKTKVATLSSIALIAVSMTLSTTSMMSTSSQAMSTAVAVPKRMHLSSGMKNSKDWLQTANLIPIDFAPSIGDLVTEKKGEAIDGSEAVKANSGKSGSIAFVVRRPGWVLCREHGQQLTELAASAEKEKSLDGFELFGVIKETGVVRTNWWIFFLFVIERVLAVVNCDVMISIDRSIHWLINWLIYSFSLSPLYYNTRSVDWLGVALSVLWVRFDPVGSTIFLIHSFVF